jgi:uncharacterized protein YbjT (DUF2867 family)
MRILVTGATGFIGRHVVAALRTAGHRVVCAVREVERSRRMFPDQESVGCDFNRDTTVEAWLPRLGGVDVVVNCVGILQSRRGQSMAAIHGSAPSALFGACARVGVRRVIQVSALGVGPDVETEYAQSKLAADRHLASLDLDWVILRPSLAYAPAGSYGGTSLFRALAALPCIVPLVGDGRQLFQPIHMADLAEAVRRLAEDRRVARRTIDVVGPEPMAMRDILLELRRWLGLGRARCLRVPVSAVRLAARIADRLGGAGPITTTSLAMLMAGNAADPAAFKAATGIAPRRFNDALAAEPAHVQDRWHARLYFLRPLLRVSIALFWVFTGLTTLLLWSKDDSLQMLRATGVPEFALPFAFHLGWAFDVILGSALLMRNRVALVGTVMVAATVIYLGLLSIGQAWQWIHPVTPLPVLVPLLVATLVVTCEDCSHPVGYGVVWHGPRNGLVHVAGRSLRRRRLDCRDDADGGSGRLAVYDSGNCHSATIGTVAP